MADPLKLLREYALEGKPIREKDNLILFGDIGFRKDERTNFKAFSKDEYYTLESLYYFYQKRHMSHPAYVKETASLTIQPVTRADRKDLIDYLSNRNAKPPNSIDPTLRLPLPVNINRQTADEGQPEPKRPRFEDAQMLQKEKERIQNLLDKNLILRPTASSNEKLRDLSDKLTADKIAAIKSKRMTLKRTKIKDTEDDIGGPGVAAVPEEVPLSQVSIGVVGDMDNDLKNMERIWLTRTTCLETAATNFQKSVFPILQTMKAREEAKSKGQSSHGAVTMKSDSGRTDASKGRSTQMAGYNRYAQEGFRKEETAGFQIDTAGTYHGVTLKSLTEGAKPLTGQPTANNISNNNRAPNKPADVVTLSSTGGQRRRVSKTPIIVIPASATSLVTMYNAIDLLQDQRYISTEEKKRSGAMRENEVLIHRRKPDGSTVPYRVVDAPLKLSLEEWERVVAVFVQGPAWQFKGWKSGDSPADIFAKLCGFHLKFQEDPTEKNVDKWNVQILELAKQRRHLDKAVLLKFWEQLETYIRKYKPHLRY